jgi:hypothetical protein
MVREIRFRMFLPVVQCALAAIFGGFGLWERSAILNQRIWGNQTLWDTTARFHVWPWPLKFAVIMNMPAFIGGTLLATVGVNLPEIIPIGLSLAVVPLFWFWVGWRFDRRFCKADELPRSGSPWVFMVVFVLLCLGGALLPLGNVGYLPYGAAVWVGAGVALQRLTRVKPGKNPGHIAGQ